MYATSKSFQNVSEKAKRITDKLEFFFSSSFCEHVCSSHASQLGLGDKTIAIGKEKPFLDSNMKRGQYTFR